MKKHYFNALIASLGSGLEYFSFITFALQAQYLSILFFPKDNQLQGILHTFLIFAVGSFFTVLGGMLFGWFGDRFGRKKAFTYAILLMSVATLGIALLPSGLGVVSLILLIIFRILQGLSQGAELPGAITFITEHASLKNRGFLCGLMFLGVGLGAGLATSINVILTRILTFQQMLDFGWRLPFFAAVLLGLTGFFLRKKAGETPVFLALKPSAPAFQSYSLIRIIIGFGLVLLGASMVSLGLYWPALLTSLYHFDAHAVFLAIMTAFILTAFFLPVFGHLGDRFGRSRCLLSATILTLLILPMLFRLLHSANLISLILFALLYYSLIVMLAANYPVMLAELYPPQVRYFSVAISYAGCYAITSFIPALATCLFLKGYGIKELLILIESIGVLSLLAGIMYYKIRPKY